MSENVSEVLPKNLLKLVGEGDSKDQADVRSKTAADQRFDDGFTEQLDNMIFGRPVNESFVNSYLEQRYPGNRKATLKEKFEKRQAEHKRAEDQRAIDATAADIEVIKADVRSLTLEIRENGTVHGSSPLQAKRILAATALERKRATNSASQEDFILFRETARAIEDLEDRLSLLIQQKNILSGKLYRLQAKLDATPSLPKPSGKQNLISV